jgi:hypothetical protein
MTTDLAGSNKVLADFLTRLARTLECFKVVDKPKWKSTQDGMLCLKELSPDKLPRKIERRLNECLVGINKVLTKYPIKTWDDYQMISDEDLTSIQQLFRNLAKYCR